MANTLYDLLEVNQSASQEAISASYKRLQASLTEPAANGDEDATNRLVALREAFTTLSSPERRKRYDDKLAAAEAALDGPEKPPVPFLKWLIVASIAIAGAVAYNKYESEKEKARLESERLIAATKAAQLAVEKERLEQEKERQERLAAERQAASERMSRERDIAYGNQVSRNLQRAEAEARWQQQREEQQRAYDERQKQYEADRQLAREKAYLRRLEAERYR